MTGIAQARSLAYDQRVELQIGQFADLATLWTLPPIHRYWTSKFINPRFRDVFAQPSINVAYYRALETASRRRPDDRVVLYSLGAGDCILEIGLALRLAQDKLSNARVVCLELSPTRLDRARGRAQRDGVAHFLEFVEADLNTWTAPEPVDLFIAHHTLHHVVELEHLFDNVRDALTDEGTLLTADMIGRNGHMRWPETLRWIDHLWRVMPERYKYQFQLNRYDEEFVNWDCSVKGFEGIREQDVLPIINERFGYHAFLAYGGIIDPWIERGYGQSLDPANPDDTAFIDFVEDLNQTLLEAGTIKPTIMLAQFCRGVGQSRSYRRLTPEFAVRPTKSDAAT